MRKFRAEKGIGEPDLEPDSPMVFSLVRKAISSREEPLHDGPSYSHQGNVGYAHREIALRQGGRPLPG